MFCENINNRNGSRSPKERKLYSRGSFLLCFPNDFVIARDGKKRSNDNGEEVGLEERGKGNLAIGMRLRAQYGTITCYII